MQLRKAEETDGLESAPEQGKGKRKRFVNSKYIQDDEDSDGNSPASCSNYEEMRNRNVRELKAVLEQAMGEDMSEKKKTRVTTKSKTGTKKTDKRMKITATDDLTDAEKRIKAKARMLAAQRIAARSKSKLTAIPAASSHTSPSGEHPRPEAETVRAGTTGQGGSAGDLNLLQSDSLAELECDVNFQIHCTVSKPTPNKENRAALKQSALLQRSNVSKSQVAEILKDVTNEAALLKPATNETPITQESLRRAINGMWSAIEGLTKTQEIVIRMQKRLDSKLDKILRSVRASYACQKPPSWPNELPLQSMANFYKFENSLNSTDFMEFAVDYFSTSGGSTPEEVARAVCIGLLSKTLASTMNLKGGALKTVINELRILQMIMAACKLALNKKFDAKKAKAAVGVWLRNQSNNKLQHESENENDMSDDNA